MSGDVLLALIWASSSSFSISSFYCSIWSARSQRSVLCLPGFVGAGGSLRGPAHGVSSWLTAVTSGSTCVSCSAFPAVRSKGISIWKSAGKAGGFFDLFPATDTIGKLKRSIKGDENSWKTLAQIQANEWNDDGTLWGGNGTWPERDQRGV